MINILSKIRNAITLDKVEKFFISLSVFLIVIYTNIMCMSDTIYGKSAVIACTFLVSSFIAFVLTIIKEKRITIQDIEFGFVILFMFIIFHNYDMQREEYNYIIKFVLFAVFIVLIKHLDWEKPLLTILFCIGLVQLAIGFFTYFNPDFYLEHIVPLFEVNKIYKNKLIAQMNDGCMLGLGSHHSTTVIYFVIPFLTSVALGFKEKKVDKWYLGYGMLFLLGIILTQKRGPFMFALITSAIYILIHFREKIKLFDKIKKHKKKIIIAIIIAVTLMLVLVGLVLSNEKLYNKINKFSSNRFEDLWEPAIVLFLKHPLVGNGWGAYKYKYLQYSGFNYIKNNSHCIYLQFLAETGIIGFTVINAGMLYTLWKTFKILMNLEKGKYKVDGYIRAGIAFSFMMQIFFLLYGFTGNPLYDYLVLLPYMIACGLCYSFMYKEKKCKIKMIEG